jgi:Arc/MetJ-type ribon-helix-helix transcriptional regulator
MIYCNTGGDSVATAKIAITIDQTTLSRLDFLVKAEIFSNRSRAIQQAVVEKLDRLEKGRLARECAKLDPQCEQKLAEEGFAMELDEWPEY